MNRNGNTTGAGAVLVVLGLLVCCGIALLLVGLGAGATDVEPDAVAGAIRETGHEPGAPSRPAAKVPSMRTAYVEVAGMVQQLGIT